VTGQGHGRDGDPDQRDNDSTERGEVPVARFRASQGGVTARFGAAQARIVRDLVGQVAELLGADPETGESPGTDGSDGQDLEASFGLTDATEAPRDPVLARLLPDAYRDDPEAAGEFRRYTELSLRDGKVAAARTVLGTLPARGGRIRLSQPDAEAWLRALNDVRLALGVRLGVTDDFEEVGNGINPADPRAAYVWVYHWLAYLQESLVEALS
jgi:Domain of unknown function (DUF2017)